MSGFTEIGPTGQDRSSPAHLSDHSWPYGGPERRSTKNILHPIDFTCSTMRYPRFSWRYAQQDKIYPLRPTFRTTFGPMVGRRVGPPKIYPIQSILLVPIYVILGFHGNRSNRTRYIFSDHSWPYGGPEGRLIENIPDPIDFSCF